MRTLTRTIALVIVTVTLPAVGGCSSSVVSLARCAAKHTTCESVAHDFEPGSKLMVRNDFGRVKLVGTEGDIRAVTEFGPVTCDEIASGNLTAKFEFGPTSRESRSAGGAEVCVKLE